jgi:GH24 family phage-related lysozyme (muramidase)
MINLLFLVNVAYHLVIGSCYSEKYELAIKILKAKEGFRSCEYTIEGVRTIGYGHTIKKNEKFGCLTINQADSLLRADFDYALCQVDRYTGITGSRKIALGHLIYCRGIGNFLKSDLYLKLKTCQELDEIDFIKYRFYESRIFEWNLWKLNCN